MNRSLKLLAFNILISLGVGVALSMVGLIFELTGFSKNQVSNIATNLGIAIATALTIYYGYRKGYIHRNDFLNPLGGRQTVYLFTLFLPIYILIFLYNEYIPLPDLLEQVDSSINSCEFIISTVLVAPIGEEIIFRGMVTKLLLEEYRPTKAILISALIFGIIHLNPIQLPTAFLLGLLFGWLYYKTRSIIPSIILHFTNNALAVSEGLYLGENWKLDNNTLALSLLAISLIALPFILKRAQLAFAGNVE